MRKKDKKNGKHDFNLVGIALATTILNLIIAMIELIEKLVK